MWKHLIKWIIKWRIKKQIKNLCYIQLYNELLKHSIVKTWNSMNLCFINKNIKNKFQFFALWIMLIFNINLPLCICWEKQHLLQKKCKFKDTQWTLLQTSHFKVFIICSPMKGLAYTWTNIVTCLWIQRITLFYK